jgi:hypothetical protein
VLHSSSRESSRAREPRRSTREQPGALQLIAPEPY